jgi:hypothetical protein
MTDNTQTATTSPTATPVLSTRPFPSAKTWLRGAMLLAGAAQLITISALVGADPVAATWATLLLAIAPAPLAALAFHAPAPVAKLAAPVGLVIMAIGIAGHIAHVGALFIPALLILAIATPRLWRE